jgi:hypothetical protein
VTTPNPNAQYREEWGQPAPDTPVTVTAAQAAAGGVQTWPLAGPLPAGWPTAARTAGTGGAYPRIFRIRDIDRPAEIIRVLTGAPGATSLEVLRGDQGTTPDAHPAGFQITNVITAEGLTARAQGVESGQGLVHPYSGLPARAAWSAPDYTVHVFTRIDSPAGEIAPGAVFEAKAFGLITVPTAGGALRQVEFGQHLSTLNHPTVPADKRLGYQAWNIRSADTGPLRWRLHCTLEAHGGNQVVGSVRLALAQSSAVATQVFKYMSAPAGSPPAYGLGTPYLPATGAGLDVYDIYAQILNVNNPAAAPALTVTVQGARAWRAA